MPFNENTYLRIKKSLILKGIEFVDKKMFGGIAFMLNDKMCFGVMKEQIMLRVLDENYELLLQRNHFHTMDFTGKIMKGFLLIDQEAFTSDLSLSEILEYGIEFSIKGIVKSKKTNNK